MFLTAKRADFLNVGGSCGNIDEGASPGKWWCLPLGEFLDPELMILGWIKVKPREDENWRPGKLQHGVCSA